MRTQALARAITVEDLHRVARKRLPRIVFDFIEGGADDERTLESNRETFARRVLRPRLLGSAHQRDQRVHLLGPDFDTPVILASTGLSRMVDREGEIAAARAAQHSGTVSILSSASSVSIARISQAVSEPQWFQLYPWGDWELSSALMDRASRAGVETLVLTLDVPVTGARERDLRNGLRIPVQISAQSAFDVLSHPQWALNVLTAPRITLANLAGLREQGRSSAASLADLNLSLLNPAFSWADVRRVRDYWPGTLVLKGIRGVEDAERSLSSGADALVVSNHGGRQADAIPASLDVLGAVAQAVGGSLDVMFDGGVRRGTDVLMVMALGAKAVLVGRPWMYGLAAGGQAGIEKMLTIFRTEIDRAMALVGVRSLGELDRLFMGLAGQEESFLPHLRRCKDEQIR